MPTRRPRHIITETDEVARALDDAAKRWPGDAGSRPKLIHHLLIEGQRAVSNQNDREQAHRLAAIKATSGLLTGVYPKGYLERLRQEWPD